MKEINFKNILKNIITTKKYLAVIILGFSIIMIFPATFHKLIIPSFKTQTIKNIVDEARRVSSHLSHSIDYKNTSTKELNKLVKEEQKEFQIDKIHYFDKKGKILYSSVNSKIGEINNHDYFHNIVANGEIYYTIKKKGEKSSEKEDIFVSTIEIYIPIIKNGVFDSAFELYYNISKEEKEFDTLSKKLTNINISIALFIAIILLGITISSSRNNLKIKAYQKELSDLAHKDSLTNIYNRRYFYDIAENLLRLAIRNNESMSICMIDIDNFKKINDKYGHQIGDLVIKSLTEHLKLSIRQSDILARYGGEEFIILFPNTNIEGTNIITQKICNDVSKLEIIIKDFKINFTISIGISELKEDQTLDEIINNADKALYKSKETGKNKVSKDIV